jgi:hypothetical protein
LKDIEEQIAQQEIDKLKTLAGQTENIDLQNFLYEEAYKAEVELIKQQRARQLEMYKTTDAFKAMEAAGDGSAKAFEEAWETATQNTINAIEKTKGKVEKVKDLTKDIQQQAVEAAAAMNLMTQLVQQDAEAKLAEVEKELEETQKEIDTSVL